MVDDDVREEEEEDQGLIFGMDDVRLNNCRQFLENRREQGTLGDFYSEVKKFSNFLEVENVTSAFFYAYFFFHTYFGDIEERLREHRGLQGRLDFFRDRFEAIMHLDDENNSKSHCKEVSDLMDCMVTYLKTEDLSGQITPIFRDALEKQIRQMQTFSRYIRHLFDFARTTATANTVNVMNNMMMEIDPLVGQEELSEVSESQKLFMKVLSIVREDNLRRLDDTTGVEKNVLLYKPKMIDVQVELADGRVVTQRRNTHFYEPYVTTSRYVNALLDSDNPHGLWKELTQDTRTAEYMKKRLDGTHGHFLPTLQIGRHLLSFRNGIYDTLQAKFFPDYQQHPDFSTYTAMQYLDMDFPQEEIEAETRNGGLVQTPVMDRILLGQHYSPALREAFYCHFIGRNMLPYTTDDQQYFTVVIGKAGTGKSSCLYPLEQVYPQKDHGIMKKVPRNGFPLNHVARAKVLFSHECGGLKIREDTLCKMVASEPLHVDIMYNGEGLIIEKWMAPLVFIGNGPLDVEDTLGNVLRRTLPFFFNHKVRDKDTTLKKKLHNEIPRIVARGARAYKKFRDEIPVGADIWRGYEDSSKEKIIPAELHENRRILHSTVDPLSSFFMSGYVELGEDFHCRKDEFDRALLQYYEDNNVFKESRPSITKIKNVMDDFEVSVIKPKASDSAEDHHGYVMAYMTGVRVVGVASVAVENDIAEEPQRKKRRLD